MEVFAAEKERMINELLRVQQDLCEDTEDRLDAFATRLKESLGEKKKCIEELTSCLKNLKKEVISNSLELLMIKRQLMFLEREQKANLMEIDSLKSSEKTMSAKAEVKKSLDLTIRKVENPSKFSEYTFEFRTMREDDPSEIFSVSVELKNGSFSVTKCSPSLSDLKSLVKKLNESRDWHSFLVDLRKKFIHGITQP